MNAILSLFHIDAQAIQKWIMIAIGGFAGKFITTLDPSMQGAVGAAITAVSAVIALIIAHQLHIAPPPEGK